MKLKDPICKKEEKLQYIAAPVRRVRKSTGRKKSKTTARKGTKKRTCCSRK